MRPSYFKAHRNLRRSETFKPRYFCIHSRRVSPDPFKRIIFNYKRQMNPVKFFSLIRYHIFYLRGI